jgi:3',5'-cyclic AMP phosphodiesterase CpdA
MRIVAVSDLHGNLPTVPPCDLLLLPGDITPVRDHRLAFQAEWLNTTFRAWLASVPARKVVGVAGNHDFLFEQAPERVPADLPWTYLQDSGTTWEGLRLWGTPWQPWFHDWAFNLYEPELVPKWALIPPGTDILVLHGPPFGLGDGVPERGGVRRCGSPSLLARIEAIRPRLVVYGHIHPGAGVYQTKGATLANVSLLDDRYEVVNGPSVFRLDAANRKTVVEAAPGLAVGERLEVSWDVG